MVLTALSATAPQPTPPCQLPAIVQLEEAASTIESITLALPTISPPSFAHRRNLRKLRRRNRLNLTVEGVDEVGRFSGDHHAVTEVVATVTVLVPSVAVSVQAPVPLFSKSDPTEQGDAVSGRHRNRSTNGTAGGIGRDGDRVRRPRVAGRLHVPVRVLDGHGEARERATARQLGWSVFRW